MHYRLKHWPQRTQMLGRECPLLLKTSIAAVEEQLQLYPTPSQGIILQLPSRSSCQVKVIILRRKWLQNLGSPYAAALTWAEL